MRLCSLDLGCPRKEFSAFWRAATRPHGGGLREHECGCESAADWVVTSPSRSMSRGTCTSTGRRFFGRPTGIWAPTCKTHARRTLLLWRGACVVHEEFKALELEA